MTDLSDTSLYPDNQLVTRSQAGDQVAFAELVRRHRPGCLKQALSILKDKQDAEDEVQNALWKAFEHITQFQQDSKFSTWLTRIVVNQCLMKLRQQRRTKLFYMDDTIGEDAIQFELPDQSPSPEETWAESELGGVIRNEVRRIPPLLRNVFLLRDIQELPMPEVAGKLGISVAAAKSRLLRARTELRSRLEKHQGQATLLA
jgi:RNA polymerase sigma-70 factor (ECF subfamily)